MHACFENDMRDLLLMARIMDKVETVGDCWEWQGHMCSGKSPVIHMSQDFYGLKTTMARVRTLVYVLTHQRKAKGMVTAGCGNLRCVNPDHLKVMTKANMTKMWCKQSISKSLKITTQKRKTAKLNADQAAQIRLAKGKEAVDLAISFGVSRSTAYKVKSGEIWRDTTSPWAGLMV